MRNSYMRRALLAFVAVLAMSAVASSTASAKTTMPELVNLAGTLPVKTGFTSTSGESTFETKSGESVKCKADTNKGKVTGNSTDEAEIKFTGCSAVSGLLKCKTKGAAAGEIVLKVKSELVWLDKAEEADPGEDLILPSEGVTIECTGLASETLKVKGSTLCPITPFNTFTTMFTLTCKATKGLQEPSLYFLGGKEIEDITETEGSGTKKFSFEKSGLTGTDLLTFEEDVKIV